MSVLKFLKYEITTVSDDVYSKNNLILMYDLQVPIQLWNCDEFDKFLNNDTRCFEIKTQHEYDNTNVWLKYTRDDKTVAVPIWSYGRFHDTITYSIDVVYDILVEMNNNIRKHQTMLRV